MQKESIVALIPARSGSKRVPGKNTRTLDGHPLIAYTIAGALQSGIFAKVIVSTESPETAEIAREYGAEVPFLRPGEFAEDASTDIQWVRHALKWLLEQGERYSHFSILRPTNPFRTADTIRRAWNALRASAQADTLRAIEPCREHPYKMWVESGECVEPLFATPETEHTPYHSRPYQSLPRIYVQNASLEIASTSSPLEHGSITGKRIMGFVTQGLEGFDINLPEDWVLAEHYIRNGEVSPVSPVVFRG